MDNISYASYTPTQPSYSSSALPNVTNYDPQYGKSNPFEQSTPYDQTVPSGSVAGYDEQIASGFTEHPQTGGGEDLSNATPMINETNVELYREAIGGPDSISCNGCYYLEISCSFNTDQWPCANCVNGDCLYTLYREAWVRPGDQGSDPSETPYGSATDAVDAPPHNFATGAGERTDPGPGEKSSAMSHPGGEKHLSRWKSMTAEERENSKEYKQNLRKKHSETPEGVAMLS